MMTGNRTVARLGAPSKDVIRVPSFADLRAAVGPARTADALEHEADVVANGFAHDRGSRAGPAATGGRSDRALDAHVRAPFESALGHDFSRVRVHTDERAGAAALGMRAAAYTVGADVFFAPGHFAPDTSAGSRLLAHELTHVVQHSERGMRSVIHRSPLPKEVEQSPEHRTLMATIMTADWRRAAALLNAYNVEGIRSVFEELDPRQVESLFLGAVANDAVGAGANVAKEALARSPELQKAVAAVVATGVSLKEFVDYSTLTHGDVMSRYGTMRFFTIRDRARSLPGAALSHLLMAEDTTLYLHRSGRVGTVADEQSRRVAEFRPHGALGSAVGLAARGVTDDPDKIEAAAATGDVVGDLAGVAAATGAARANNRGISASGAAQQDPPGIAGDRRPAAKGPTVSTNQGKGDYVSPKVSGELPATAGVTQRPLPTVRLGGASTAPPNVRAAAVTAMVADPKRGSGIGGEAAAMEARKSEGAAFDVNRLKGKGGNFPALDFTTPGGFYSAKSKDVGKPLTDGAVARYMNDLDTLYNSGGPGFATTTAQKAAGLISQHRETIQKANAWPAALPKDATEGQILQEIARNGKVVIPDDHVEPVRQAIAREVARNPGRWPGEDTGHLQQRIQPMGITSGELAELHQQTQK